MTQSSANIAVLIVYIYVRQEP